MQQDMGFTVHGLARVIRRLHCLISLRFLYAVGVSLCAVFARAGRDFFHLNEGRTHLDALFLLLAAALWGVMAGLAWGVDKLLTHRNDKGRP